MARTVKNARTDSRTARSKLPERREPYWTVIVRGCAIGYRRGAKGGSWIGRYRDDAGRQHYEALGAADDAVDANGASILDWAQAQTKARAWFGRIANGGERQGGVYSVGSALDDYFTDRERRGSKGLPKDRAAGNLRIRPDLGDVDIHKLTTKKIRDWHSALASSPRLARASRSPEQRKETEIDTGNHDEVRARRATANRTLTVLKAALNFAFHEGRAATDDAWRKVKPFREVDAAVVRFLSDDECRRIVNSCVGAFRHIVRGALLTGCRYGELTRMIVADYTPESGMIAVRLSKAGKPRHVALNDEGRALFDELTNGKSSANLIFTRDDGEAWGDSHQQRPLEAACSRAKIDPAATFHILRHTYASSLAMRGVPMGVIAAQLGHADTRITERHYAHLSPSYVADTVRAALPALGIVEPSNVERIGRKTA